MYDLVPIRGTAPGGGQGAGATWPALDLLLCCVALTALEFVGYSQTPAAYTFAGASAISAMSEPGRALNAAHRGGALWAYVALCLASVLWSPVPDVTLRYALEVALTIGAGLVMARALPARSFLTALMFALMAATAASLLDPRSTWNMGQLAMIGIFGSKNQFGQCQADLVMVCAWVFLDARRSLTTRGVAFLGISIGVLLLVAARSVDSTVAVMGAVGCSYFAFAMKRFSPRRRVATLYAVILFMAIVIALLFIVGEQFDLIGQGLQAVGKDSTLTGRTVLWDRAAKMMEANPILGVGLGAFWVEGNPYAEQLWARFDPGRTGYNFHNMWYETGVAFGYVGILVLFMILVGATMAVIRWVLESPSAERCFFLSFMIYADVRTFIESEMLGAFSILTVILVAAWVYARRSPDECA